MAEFWSDYTDFVLTNIDRKIGGKYKLSLKGLLGDPSKFASQPNIQNTIKNLAEEVNKYLDATLASMGDERKALTDQLLKADAVTKQLAQSVAMQAKQYKVPVVKPVSIQRDETRDETIFVDTVTQDITSLIEKLAGTSTVIADFSYSYQNATIGSWLFSGRKDYVLNVFLPDNDVVMLEASRAEISDLLDAAGVIIQGI
jgi:hypothetical protein